MQTFSLLVIQGNLSSLPVDERGMPRIEVSEKAFLHLDSEGKVYYADPNPKIKETIEVIAQLVEWAFACGRIPLAVVQPQQAHAESGIARQIQFLPLIDMVTELTTYDEQSEREFAAKVLTVAREAKGAQPSFKDVLDEIAGFTMTWSENFYPTDEETKLNVYDQRRELRLESRLQQLAREHPELDEAELKVLADEIDAEEDARVEKAAFAEQGAGGFGQQVQPKGNEKP